MLAAEEDALRVDVLHALPRLDGRLEDAGVVGGRDAGVVVEDVDAAEALARRRVHRATPRLVGDVGVMRERLAFARGDRLLGSAATRRRRRRTTTRGFVACRPRRGDRRNLPVERLLGAAFTITGSHFLYGAFINALITFVVIAAVIFFLVVKPVNALMERRRTELPVEVATRPCPECLSEIPEAATRCAFCTAVVGAA